MSTNQAVFVDTDHRLILSPAPEPNPTPAEAVIEVAATSLNRGETRRALTRAQPGWRPGWDIAGVVAQEAANGSGPRKGARVVGLSPNGGGWARRITAATNNLAEIPPEISFTEAASLPVAGLTALHALSKRGNLIGRRVLITGATGGVGHFACQLARAAGATTVAAVRNAAQIETARVYGAQEVVATGDDPAAILSSEPYDLILESVGGAILQNAMSATAPGGVCVCVGVSSSAEVRFDAEAFFYSTASLIGIVLFKELQFESADLGLSRLVRLLGDGRLTPHIGQERSWTEINEAARDLIERKSPGKIILHMDDRV